MKVRSVSAFLSYEIFVVINYSILTIYHIILLGQIFQFRYLTDVLKIKITNVFEQKLKQFYSHKILNKRFIIKIFFIHETVRLTKKPKRGKK